MPAPDARTSARDALDEFIRHLAGRQFAAVTQRIRRHFLEEYLQHAQQAAGTIEITVAELLDPERAGAWLCDAAVGKTRIRNTLRGRDAAAYPNSMRVRIDSYNSFALTFFPTPSVFRFHHQPDFPLYPHQTYLFRLHLQFQPAPTFHHQHSPSPIYPLSPTPLLCHLPLPSYLLSPPT